MAALKSPPLSAGPEYRLLLGHAIRAAAEAGRCIEAHAGGRAVLKGDGSPATAADREADALLRGSLLEALPAAWLSEETVDDNRRLGAELVWIVDPLDGTKEFIERVPQYAVAIALVSHGTPQLAVVHNPVTGEMFSAIRGQGASRNFEPLRVRPGRTLLASRTELRSGEFEPFRGEWELEGMGSIQYKLACVAAGRAALTLSRGPKHEWDLCAGALLVEEAGGVALDLFGNPLRFNQPFPKSRGVLAGESAAVASASRCIAAIGASDRMRELGEAI